MIAVVVANFFPGWNRAYESQRNKAMDVRTNRSPVLPT